jgi:diphosphomevalonate decarboxylase
MSVTSATAIACSNIALAKYWGKASDADNLTAVPSLSLTLAELRTKTKVSFDSELSADELALNAEAVSGRALQRVSKLLGEVRKLAKIETFARVESQNDFPTAAGLASSASGFAALALAATRAAGLDLSLTEVSCLARRASASAGRSLFGGYVALEARAESAERIMSGADWPLAMLVAVTAVGPKDTASTDGMQHTRATSPYYPAWVEHAPRIYREIRAAVEKRDLERLGPFMEQSALMMHASMFAALPPIIYFAPTTLSVIQRVRELRKTGILAFFTMDAGPHVKVLTNAEAVDKVQAELARVPGVEQVLRTGPGPDAFVLSDSVP